jgi:hypothetical protein
MLKFVAILLALGVLGYAAVTFFSSAGSLGDPVTSSANLDLKVRAQAGIAVAVAGASNRMRQVMAAGDDPVAHKQMLDDLASLHQDVDKAREQLTKLGDSPAAIDHWLGIIRWNEFLALEQEFTKADKNK